MVNRAKSLLNWRVAAFALGIVVFSSLAIHAQTNARGTVPIRQDPIVIFGGKKVIVQPSASFPPRPGIGDIRPGGSLNGSSGVIGNSIAGNSGTSGTSGNGGFGGTSGNNGGFGGGGFGGGGLGGDGGVGGGGSGGGARGGVS